MIFLDMISIDNALAKKLCMQAEVRLNTCECDLEKQVLS